MLIRRVIQGALLGITGITSYHCKVTGHVLSTLFALPLFLSTEYCLNFSWNWDPEKATNMTPSYQIPMFL